MWTLLLLTGCTALVIGAGETKWASWRRRLLFYTWGVTLGLSLVFLPVALEVIR